MNRTGLIESLNNITEKIAKKSIREGVPLYIDDSKILVGQITVEKDNDGFYNIYDLSRRCLYEGIGLLATALIIAKVRNTSSRRSLQTIFDLDIQYSKYKTDLIYLTYNLKKSQDRHDYERIDILYDKIQNTKMNMASLSEAIESFK